MLDKLVRPLVRTQIQILVNSKAAGSQLVTTIARWLSYLGVHAEVRQLQAEGKRIRVALSVGKPDQCSEQEWAQILDSLDTAELAQPGAVELTYQTMSDAQKRKASRLLAHIIQVGNPNALQEWNRLRSQLLGLGLESDTLDNIRVALKVPQFLDSLLRDLDPEVAAFVLSRAIGIALIDQRITPDEDSALKRIYKAIGDASAT